MKAITTSIRSADRISVRIWCPTRGSPGELVSNVVSRRGISGPSIDSPRPSGRRPEMLRNNSEASVGRSIANSRLSGRSSITLLMRWRASSIATLGRQSSSTASTARSTTRAICIAIRSAASAALNSARTAIRRSSRRASWASNASVTTTSYSPLPNRDIAAYLIGDIWKSDLTFGIYLRARTPGAARPVRHGSDFHCAKTGIRWPVDLQDQRVGRLTADRDRNSILDHFAILL